VHEQDIDLTIVVEQITVDSTQQNSISIAYPNLPLLAKQINAAMQSYN